MKTMDVNSLFRSVKELIDESRSQIVRNVNTRMIQTYYHIGMMIVQEQQKGNDRAEYAEEIVAALSRSLSEEYGKGYSKRNLDYFKQFYLLYRSRIVQSAIAQSPSAEIPKSLISFSEQFKVSWTHYIQLMRINDANEREFYEQETAGNNWSVRELQRQYNSSYYERLVLSSNKKEVQQDAAKGGLKEMPVDTLKTPFVLEFLNFKEDSSYSENDLETAIINKLEHFMLELGKGFLFEGRQRRITLEGDHFWVDLVFYNRLLDCFVLIDLKIGKLTHQDIGQMQMYVNYYDRKVKRSHEKPTLGIILCKEDNKAVVEFTLPLNNEQIFSREYKLYLPSKEELQKQLL
ncbi:YhcG family protein [Mucilaginibacter sp. AW1-7]|uniref:PDDEXK nuclease domain-containing protein n=1 Tax=Mucilaginibacter sp. AW1-7 TaxID=3349874 RepID=UPI003F73B72E